MKELTIEAKALMISLAMDIEVGKIKLEEVLREIDENPKLWTKVLSFWASFNEMTQKVLDLLFLEHLYLLGE